MGRCLDIDARGVEQLLETRYHLRYMRRELRLLSDYGEVGIDHLIARLAHHLHDGGEELCAVGTTVPLVGIGEVVADISLADSSEESIHQSVQCHVCIGVTEQSQWAGDAYATEDERSVWRGAMYVVARAYAVAAGHARGSLLE